MSSEKSASVALGGCDADGNRTLRLVSVVEPSSPDDQIQWYVDGQPFGPAMAPGRYEGKVPGDGDVHLLELRVLSPEGVPGDQVEMKFPLCSQNAVGHIRSVDFADRQDDGSLPIRLVSKMEPSGLEATVQWLIDGELLDGPVPAGVHATKIKLPGGVRQIELRVLEPEGAQGDLEEVEFPGPKVEARIAVAEFEDEEDLSRHPGNIAVAEFEDDDDLAKAPDRSGEDSASKEAEEEEAEEARPAHIASIQVGDADRTGRRELRLTSAGDDATMVGWSINGELLTDLAAPGDVVLETKVIGDTTIGLHIGDDEPELAMVHVGSTEKFELDIGEVSFTPVQNGRTVLRTHVELGAADNTRTGMLVQWYLDGVEIGKICDVGEAEFDVDADGRGHQLGVQLVGHVAMDSLQTQFPDSAWLGPTIGAVAVSPAGEGTSTLTVALNDSVTQSGETGTPIWYADGEPVLESNLDEPIQLTVDSTMKRLELRLGDAVLDAITRDPDRWWSDAIVLSGTAVISTTDAASDGEETDGSEDTNEAAAIHQFCPEGCDDHDVLHTEIEAAKSTAEKQHPLWVVYKLPWSKEYRQVRPSFPTNSFLLGVAANANQNWDHDRLKAMLPPDLKPTKFFDQNIYFVNGINKNWKGAHGQALYINSFLGSQWNVRLIHNKTTTLAGDSNELNVDYAWSPGKEFKSLCTTSIFSLLLHSYDANAPIGLIGSSGGTLKTTIALRAFASLGSKQRSYLKAKVQLVHLGCLAHRSLYSWLDDHLHNYVKHVDRRDPFARYFSGEKLPLNVPGYPPGYPDPATVEGKIVSQSVIEASKPAYAAMAMAAVAGLFAHQGRYHAIRNNYMEASGARHCSPSDVFQFVEPPPDPLISRFRIGLKTGTAINAGTKDAVSASIGGVKISCVDQDGKLDRGGLNWFYGKPSSPIRESKVDRITITKGGKNDWKLKGLTIQADTDKGLRTLYENASLNYWYTGNNINTWLF